MFSRRWQTDDQLLLPFGRVLKALSDLLRVPGVVWNAYTSVGTFNEFAIIFIVVSGFSISVVVVAPQWTDKRDVGTGVLVVGMESTISWDNVTISSSAIRYVVESGCIFTRANEHWTRRREKTRTHNFLLIADTRWGYTWFTERTVINDNVRITTSAIALISRVLWVERAAQGSVHQAFYF